MFIKIGETHEISRIENEDSCIPAVNQEMLDNFKKTATALKKIAPKANDFLYFSAVMMHAAEAVSLNEDGTPKLNAKGEAVQVGWDKSGNTWRWQTNDPSLKPYKNSNGDIFPEEELIKAHKKWVHKPLCIDHKSSSVDHTRGFIVDTYYDRNLKRVIALCALDKANYPDLAKKVASMMQTSVSMGTAVGRAICSDCGKVARAEPDFCDHMRKKTCYGEINIDLSPIELSIVVNGADPRAHIKHIIAAANTLNTYVENKASELNKLAEEHFSGTIRYSDSPESKEETGSSVNFDVEAKSVEELQQKFEQILEQVSEIQKKIKEEPTNDTTLESDSQDSNDIGIGIPANARYASSNLKSDLDSIIELREVTAAIESKLQLMKEKLNKLAYTSNIQKEQHMSGSNFDKRGYFQGGGGVNEPTPGQAKYTKDPLNEEMRMKGDKQMVGQSPFPGVGDVTGLHPSPASADESDELSRKKMLARAEAEDRAIRRSAIVQLAKQALQDKRAYYQGGSSEDGGVNEPTPGKTKYTPDPLNMSARKEDKQMVGQKPFPGVGDVDGLHPSPVSADEADELKRKQMLSRAGLKAKFVKAANVDGTPNFGNSAWQVFVNDRLLLTASVNDLSGGNTHMMYDTIATKDFGSKLLEKVKVYGADGVRALVKKAQEAAPAAPPAPEAAAPAAAPAAPAAPPAPAAADMPEEKEIDLEGGSAKSGDPGQVALDLAEENVKVSDDLLEAIKALTGEKEEMGAIEEMGMPEAAPAAPEMGATASFSTSSLNTLRKELNGALIRAMKESVAELKDHRQELEMIAGLYRKGSLNAANKKFAKSIVEDAFAEAKTAKDDAIKLMTAFVKYARGTQALVKRARMESVLRKNAAKARSEMNMAKSHKSDMHMLNPVSDLLGDVDVEEENLAYVDDMSGSDYSLLDDNDADATVVAKNPQQAAEIASKMDGGQVVMASVNSKSNRAALRAKLAADALGKMDDGELVDMSKAEYSDMLEQSHALTNGQTKLDVKPSDELGLVETLEQQKAKMMDVATAPPKVRKEAEAVHKLVSEGKLDPADIPALVAEGLDPAVAKYYQTYFGQVEGGSEFASDLLKEHAKAHVEEELNTYRVKLARAYELAYDMAARGLCLNDRDAISNQVEEIMKFNDDSFESLKRVVAKHSPAMHKEAGRMPQVGMIGFGDTASAQSDDWSQLSAAFSKTNKRMF